MIRPPMVGLKLWTNGKKPSAHNFGPYQRGKRYLTFYIPLKRLIGDVPPVSVEFLEITIAHDVASEGCYCVAPLGAAVM